MFHTNEGHAGFLGLERIRDTWTSTGCRSRGGRGGPGRAVFTTHTPVPAGIDRFPRELMERYFGNWAARVRHLGRRA